MEPNVSEESLYAVAATCVRDQEHAHLNLNGSMSSVSVPRSSSIFDLGCTSKHNSDIIQIAKSFLFKTCPELLGVLDSHYDQKSAQDRLIKIGRNLNATLRYNDQVMERKGLGKKSSFHAWLPEEDETIENETFRKLKTEASLKRLVKECQELATLLKHPVKIPTVRYGRTGIQMPIVTLGCMRFQQSWNRGGVPITTPDQIEKDCQDNLVNILRYAIHCGVNHIETAHVYGSSELQIGLALKVLFDEGVCRREDLIIQTKGVISSATCKSSYKESILRQLQSLGLEYVDLFSVHGLNTEYHLEWLFDNGVKGNLIEAVQELKAEGKIRWIGFSTHAPSHVIKQAIETDVFDYINLHHHFMGSYTCSGEGDQSYEGNLQNLRLAHKHDMGVFIISPYDKGGRIYAPSHLVRELTLPEMEPFEYGSLWLWYHEHYCLGIDKTRVNTIVCGAGRPSDLDQPVLAALRSVTKEAREEFEVVTLRIRERKEKYFGKDWSNTWHLGLPNYFLSHKGSQIGNMVWLYNVIHWFGLMDYAKERYETLINNSLAWDINKSQKENVFSNPAFNWMPGCGFDPLFDYSSELKGVPQENISHVLKAMKFVHQLCSSAISNEAENEKKDLPLEWETAYDMRPWVAFPERS